MALKTLEEINRDFMIKSLANMHEAPKGPARIPVFANGTTTSRPVKADQGRKQQMNKAPRQNGFTFNTTAAYFA